VLLLLSPPTPLPQQAGEGSCFAPRITLRTKNKGHCSNRLALEKEQPTAFAHLSHSFPQSPVQLPPLARLRGEGGTLARERGEGKATAKFFLNRLIRVVYKDVFRLIEAFYE